MGKVLDIKALYESSKQKIKDKVSVLGPLTLASVRVGNNYSAEVYFSQQEKMASELGLRYLPVSFPGDAKLDEVLDKIKEFNEDDEIKGIVVNKPFPIKWKEEAVFSAISPSKDIEGLNPYNLGMLMMGKPGFVSPTVRSIIASLDITKTDLRGKDVTIIGSSVLIGKPLSIILANRMATVSVTHIATYEKGRIPFYVSNADILVSAVGKPGLIKGEWIKEGAIVIDVGIGEKDGRLSGDVEFEAACERASFITPVPGGIGKLTTVFLFENLINASDKN